MNTNNNNNNNFNNNNNNNKNQNNPFANAKDIILTNYAIHHFNRTMVFRIPTYFRIMSVLGKGAYGDVVAAMDLRTHTKVAIKKVVNLFEQNKFYQKRICREVKIMKHFSSSESTHENVLQLFDLIPPISFKSFRDIYIVTPLMEFDLTRITSVQKSATDRMVKYLIYQILDGIEYLHSMGIVHRDIKPANILINRQLDVKICDFGLARGVLEGCEISSTYVATRYYRAPELCLAWKKSSFACDIWSVGCIFAELLSKYPSCWGKTKVLFPGTNSLDQLKKIFMVLGKPNLNTLKACEEGRKWVQEKVPNNVQRYSLSSLFKHVSKDGIDLLHKMLTINPSDRITAKEAMKHKYFADIINSLEKKKKTVNEFGVKEDTDMTMIDKFSFRFDENKIKSVKKEMLKDVMTWIFNNGFKGNIKFDNNMKHIYL